MRTFARLDLPAFARSYALKIALLAAAFAIPTIAIMFALLRQINDVEAVTRQQQQAAAAIDDAAALQRRIEDYRDTIALPIPPTTGVLPLGETRENVDRAVRLFDRRPGATFDTGSQWNAVLAAWNVARRDRRGASGAHETAMIAALFKYIDRTSDRSLLTYDSQIDVQSMADVLSNNYVRGIEAIRLANLHAVKAAAQGGISLHDRVELFAEKQRFFTRIATITDDVRQSTEANTELRAPLAPLRAEFFSEGRSYAEFLQAKVIEADRIGLNAADLDRRARKALAAYETAGAIASPQLHLILHNRLDAMRKRKATIAISTFVALLLGVLIATQITRAMSKRDREELARAQQRAAFLAAELAREQAERALKLTEAQFHAVFNDAAIGIAILDKRGTILEANPTFTQMLGEDPPNPLFLYHQFFDRLLDGVDDPFELEHPMAVGDEEKWVDATLSVVRAPEDATFVVWMLQDVTERKRTEQRLVHDATHDALTGLANRAYFEQQLSVAFSEARVSGRADFAVLFVDLDHFKYINDSFGHAIGDLVLSTISDRLRASVNATDVVARFGGDEFAILLRGVEDAYQIDSIGRRIQRNVEQPLVLGGSTVFTTASIGISIGSQDYERAEDMLRDADTAMYNAKLGGRARHVTFDILMHTRAANRLQLQSELREAVDTHQFRLVYQPVVRIIDGSLVGCEALVRWNHPERGIVSPGDFMPFAEQVGLAIPIGRFVFREACAQIAEWLRMRSDLDGLTMNVNVSVSELFAPDFERFVVETLKDSGVPGSAIILEITESAIIDREVYATELIDRLRSHGLRICIDDFGTGYSSFQYLQQFKIDSLKIDRSFIAGEDGGLASPPIVQSLISLADAFGVRLVAEGVETQVQRDALIAMGCSLGQGYLFARPLAPDLLLPV